MCNCVCPRLTIIPAVKTCIMLDMANLETRVPKQNDTVTVEGRAGSFAVIGIDAVNKTVEVRGTSAPFALFRAPWATISYTGLKP